MKKIVKNPPVHVSYCTVCGQQNRVTWVDVHYSSRTGQLIGNLLHRCPNWRWYKFWHASFKSDIDGNTYAHEI